MHSVVREKKLRGLRTAWLQSGPSDGAPILLLLHGFPDSAECWEHQIEAFSATHTVIAPFVRGAGPSERPASLRRYGPDAIALDVLAILDEVDPNKQERVYIVGHDLGVVHAWHIARLLQKRVGAVAVINGLTVGQMARRWQRPRQVLKSWYMGVMQIPVLPEALYRFFGKPLVEFAHERGGLALDKRPSFGVVKDALRGPLNQYRAFVRTIPRALKGDRRLKCPMLVLWGRDDAFLLPPTKPELASDAENVTIRILSGNHWLHREQPEKVNRLLQEFFSQPGGVE